MRASLGALVAQADDGARLNSDLTSLRHESAPARSDIVGRLREVRVLEGANTRSGESTSQSHADETAALHADVGTLRLKHARESVAIMSDVSTMHQCKTADGNAVWWGGYPVSVGTVLTRCYSIFWAPRL